MSKLPTNDEGMNDADLATLFALNNSEPPKELDQLILQNARLSQQDSLPQQSETFIQKYAPLFGTAAVLMIAFALTPLTMNAPESMPDMAIAPAPQSKTTPAQFSPAESAAVPTDRQAIAKTSQTTLTNSDTDTAAGTTSVASASIEAEPVPAEPVASNTASNEPNSPELMADADTDAVGTELAEEPAEDESIVASVNVETEISAPEPEPIPQPIVEALANSAESVEAEAEIESEVEIETGAGAGADELEVEESKRENAMPADSDNVDATAHLGDSSDNPTDTLGLQLAPEEPQVDTEARIGELEISAVAPNTLVEDDSVLLRQLREPVQDQSTRLRAEQDTTKATKPARVKAKNYRGSALLWAIEIKHLYNEKNIEQAREELALFRKKYPDNGNERLLPEKLLEEIEK